MTLMPMQIVTLRARVRWRQVNITSEYAPRDCPHVARVATLVIVKVNVLVNVGATVLCSSKTCNEKLRSIHSLINLCRVFCQKKTRIAETCILIKPPGSWLWSLSLKAAEAVPGRFGTWVYPSWATELLTSVFIFICWIPCDSLRATTR